ncbi:putative signal transducing protein [Gemmatimonadota bacterium]
MIDRRAVMSHTSDAEGSLIKIYTARNTLESSLIRKVLTEKGIRVLIPAEEFDAVAGSGIEPEAIFVPEADRDRAIQLLQKVWDILDPPGDDADGQDGGSI